MFGRVRRAQIALGAHTVNLTRRMIGLNKLKAATGVYVFEINSVAGINNSGVKPGDIIVEFDLKPVSSVDNLHKYLNEDVIGKKISLGVLRGGIKHTVTVIPGEIR